MGGVSTALDTSDRFSATIREVTVQDHRDAEGSALMRHLVEGTLPPDRFGLMLAQLLVVYRSLETVASQLVEDPSVAPFLLDGLERVPALDHDLRGLGLDPDAITALPAAQDYADRIAAMADWPGGFVAHHYTRYLGDLSGGQFIRRAVERAYPDLDIAFYTFAEVSSPKALKDDYRHQLDVAPWDEAERGRVLAEIRHAYALNTALFVDLDRAA